MQRGPWHQCGAQSQTVVKDLLTAGVGVGVVISPRDLAKHNAIQYAQEYRAAGAEVLLDHQYYVPDFTNSQLESYDLSQYRASVSNLHQISDSQLTNLAQHLQTEVAAIQAHAVLAPAVVYEAGRPDIVDLNSRLFNAAKQVGNNLGIPTFATVVLSHTVGANSQQLSEMLSQVTGLDSDGWYYGYEFQPERIPSSVEQVKRCCAGGLLLACTGKPVLHAYAGPMSILSFGFGATGAAIGHPRNTWQFNRGRFGAAETGGGQGGPPPPRFFSRSLWGTIIYPDEVAQLGQPLQNQVLVHSPYSTATGNAAPWPEGAVRRHTVHSMCTEAANVASQPSARQCANQAISLLNSAYTLHTAINTAGLSLRDDTNCYQANWAAALTGLLAENEEDFDYLEIIS